MSAAVRFQALRVHAAGNATEARLETLGVDDLADGNVLIRGAWSSINYKDALAVTGRGRILRRFPLVAGVDVAGTVVESGDPRIAVGAAVAVCGCGLGETHDGGLAGYVRVPGDWVNPLPAGLDPRTAMAIGTAGFTAALAIHRLEQNGQRPALGPVAVTGATGGVGSVAINLLAGLGYAVTALTSKATADEYLSALGAGEVLHLAGRELGTRPLEKALFGGAIDNVGGPTLAWLTRTVVPNGNIASIGLAQGADLHTTVMPFILRGVSLLGINSVEVDRTLRLALWQRLAADLRPTAIDRIVTREIDLADVPAVAGEWVDGRITGRCLVRLAS